MRLLHSQNPNFTLNDFVRYIGQTKKDPGWDAVAQTIAFTAVDLKGKTIREQSISVQQQFNGTQGMTGEKLYRFLQAKIYEAIAFTNQVAKGGPGKGGASGDQIIDSGEREELQQNPVAATVLDSVIDDVVRGRHGR